MTGRHDEENKMKKYICPCCGNAVFDEEPPGTFQICPVCGWEDDRAQYLDPDLKGGANRMSLNEAREAFDGKRK
ncbi:MAG: hydrolase [Eubacteriaceae bacterium]|jgi:uncharacterized Zn finger protein (UPF0148 family)|nr:hydrolase [Eubacteriaceae bacterium]